MEILFKVRKLIKSPQQPENCLESKCSLSINLVRVLVPPGEFSSEGDPVLQRRCCLVGQSLYILQQGQQMFLLSFSQQALAEGLFFARPYYQSGHLESERYSW